MSQNDLFDLKHAGNFLSWRGKRGTHLVHCRLDRALSNPSWTELFPSCRSQYLHFEGSDHRPLISFLDPTRKKGTRLFRYDRRLKGNEEVKKLISDIWSDFSHLNVEERLSLCRKAIAKWSKETQINSQKHITSLKSQLEAAMASTDQNLQESIIQEINMNLLKAYKAEEAFWQQRSRLLWLSLGDSNTGFFHAVTKSRRARNKLSIIKTKRAYLGTRRNRLQKSSLNTMRLSSQPVLLKENRQSLEHSYPACHSK